MRFTLRSLAVALKRNNEIIPLHEVNYFYGQMGSGKTSIARLIDYCLGGDIELSPALQSEFVGATLTCELENGAVSLERPRDSNRVIARWEGAEGPHQVNIPARDAQGEVVPGANVETVSDLLFWLSGVTPPRVRKSRTKQDTDLIRLSMRDLFWYCYLDQDSIDSEFFYLEEKAHPHKRLKSREVLRYLIGFHEEKVAEIEAEIDNVRGQRQALAGSIDGLASALGEVGVGSEEELVQRIGELHGRADALGEEIRTARAQATADPTASAAAHTRHALDDLRARSRKLSNEVAQLDEAIQDVVAAIDRDRRHLHEIETLGLKFRRSVSAKSILSGVTFESCPRCAKPLPESPADVCPVCTQSEEILEPDPTEMALVDRDAKARIEELRDVLARHETAIDRLRRERRDIVAQKERIERERNEAASRNDSAYLSTMLTRESERISLLQEAASLERLSLLPRAVTAQREKVEQLIGREAGLRTELRAAREAAERDTSALDQLKELFLDCLLRAQIPGITSRDYVEIVSPNFLPEVHAPDGLDNTVTSFDNISSGGKKTLFKCCFAVAVHRLAAATGATLPEVLIIDSPMKNISERENREQFEGFYRLLYELKIGELSGTQLILIDKEYCPPPDDVTVMVATRHMRPEDDEFPPLIRYYRGH